MCHHKTISWPLRRDGYDISSCLTCGEEIIIGVFGGQTDEVETITNDWCALPRRVVRWLRRETTS